MEKMYVKNPGFEAGLSGWTSMFQTGEGYSFAVTDEKSRKGRYSLKIDDRWQNRSVAVYSDPIPVRPRGIYKGSVQLFIESGTPSLLIRIYDREGRQLAEEAVQVKNGEQRWQKIEKIIAAPENAVYARLFALSTSYALTSAYFDDFAFYALKEKPDKGEAGSVRKKGI